MAKAHPTNDEYVWNKYTLEYSAQVEEMEKTAGMNGSDFLIKKWDVIDGKLHFYDKLHGNWKCIYSTIYNLNPDSVFECGCGGMYHLKNIKTLLPNITIGGCDLLQTQVDFGQKKFNIPNDILANILIKDFSALDAVDELNKYEFVYSHAVLMHLSGEKATQFLRNMLAISEKYVFFIEGDQHDYKRLLSSIGEQNNWSIKRLSAYNSWLLTKI